MKQLRMAMAIFIACVPLNIVRVALYRWVLGHDIDFRSRVAAFTILHAERVSMASASIGPLNLIRLGELRMAEGALIGKLNFISRVRQLVLEPQACILTRNFIGGTHGTEVACGREALYIGAESQISISCFIDVSDQITLGRNVVIAGAGTQFWTHGFDHLRQRCTGPIVINDNVFVGSASTLIQGVEVCANVVIGAGSVVHRRIEEPGSYASSQLRKLS